MLKTIKITICQDCLDGKGQKADSVHKNIPEEIYTKTGMAKRTF